MQVLGKRLGPALREVGAAIKALSSEAVLAAQAAGKLEVVGTKLDISDIKVRGVHSSAFHMEKFQIFE